MKSFLLCLFIFICFRANATTYYFSTSGNDANNGTSPSTPWQTISKLNSVFASKSPGDNFLFNRGDVFYGSLAISRSGSSGLPITIGTYGTGANPVITGFTSVTTWTNLGSNIWESTSTVSSLSTCNMVVINGVNTHMGRTPNTGYYTYQSFSGSTSITSSGLSGIPNWTGAQAVIRKTDYVTDRCSITAQSGSTITFTDPVGAFTSTNNYGFFIQNDVRTLDAQNEWYYNPSTKKIRIYSTNSPSNVLVSTIDNIISMGNSAFITIDGIDLTGANNDGILFGGNNTTIENCNIKFAGTNCIESTGGNNSLINNNTISSCGKSGIFYSSANTGSVITNNQIYYSGVIEGQTDNGSQTNGIFSANLSAIIQYNVIKGTGSHGIFSKGDNTLIQYNFLDSLILTTTDQGGIYTHKNTIIDHNIILNAIGNGIGSNGRNVPEGIYLDDDLSFSNHNTVTNNTVAYSNDAGLKIHQNSDNYVSDNTFYDNKTWQVYYQDNAGMSRDTLRSNILFSKLSTQFCYGYVNGNNNISSTGPSDSNYFARPMDDNLTFQTYQANTNYVNRTLATWQSFTGFDAHSHKSPKTITNVSDLRFEYNATSSGRTISLDANYIDVKNVSYNGTITLAPYTSAILIRNGVANNQPPTANAGADQIITLPTNSFTFSGSGTDLDGTISSYQWTKISGPSGYNIANATLPGTAVTGLAQGVYQFQLKVTDNSGATGLDTMQLTVNAAPNQPPVANAGSDQTITLPTNTVTLSGTGTDADGIVVSYTWTQISGPSGCTITKANSAVTNVTGLVKGTYQFQVTVTDNSGATGTDMLLIMLNDAVNIPPVANAGSDQTITLPTNTVTLSGNGTDADGTVVSYVWAKISGPSGYNIVNGNSPVTDVTGLVQGTYQFQLTVTDNGGAIGTAIIQIVVDAAINQAPVANAGIDQTITLPANTVTLSGSGTDADGSVVSYIWTEISGPSSYNIVYANSSVTSVTSLKQGVYQFQLQVTDNSGAIGTDIVQVTVNGAINMPPVANAGSNQTVTLPVNTITLSGSGTDADGTVVAYTWSEISGPTGFSIVNPSSPVTSVTNLLAGVYQFQLEVTDNSGAIATGTVEVTVNAAANIPPIANAGTDQSITLPVNTITLSGDGTDADGTVVGYAWTEISGPSGYNIVSANSPTTDVTGLVQGVYKFQIQVTDNNGATGTDIIQIIVNPAANIPPVANAGQDQIITLPANTITLVGNGSDADGTIVNYIWTQISGPAGYNIVNSNSPVTDVNGLAQGTYQFQLQVTDNNGAIGTDIVQITVNAAINMPPVANAGANQTISLPANTITLSGSGTDADGTVVRYVWTEISGPSGYNIADTNSVITDVTGLVQGIYQFQLEVTDNSGAIGTDIIQVTVNAAANTPPVANAGADQSITLPVNTITLSGSGTDADGTVVGYSWIEISGPINYNILNANSAATDVTGLVQGVYQFQLEVTDNNGATATDIIRITVSAAANIPPVADAGSDQNITLPVNSITLSGSGSDADGTVAAYKWTKISGPSGYTIVNANSAITTVRGLVQGTYQFQLRVKDNKGATATDIIQVTVSMAANIPPVANAGSDQTMTLPVNTVTLSGTGTDADGTVVGYAWTQISGPSAYNIVNANSPVTDVNGLIEGTYQFQLEVTDNDGAIGISLIQVIVNAVANIPPVVNAGPDQTITLPVDSVSFAGSGTDADGVVVTYQWTEISGPASYNIVNGTFPNGIVNGLVQGVYQFELQVTDDNGASSADTMQIVVNAATNIPPVANAGSDQTITLPTSSVIFSGSGGDVDGTIVSYAWTNISGPSGYNIVDPTSPGTDVTGLTQGVYRFQLTVTDNDGATGNDTIQVTVNIAGNISPVANAGSDNIITLPTNSLAVSGSGSDADGTVVGYQWTKISGPSSYSIVNPTSAVTDITGLVQGVYQFQLKVTDNNGATGTDIMQITVNAAANIPPVANAGADWTIALPTNSLTVSGSGTDADGTVTTYQWTKISGPSAYTITNATSAVTNITGLVKGVYKFQLKVTDNDGATGTDIMQVTVNAAANIPPVADAGTDQTITLPVNSTTLIGSGSDADGTISGYRWTKISGPSSYNIVNPTTAATDITGLVQGVYQFQLKVTDNDGATGTDIMQVTVNAAANIPPVADAGPDQVITLPADSANLAGSGNDSDGTIVGYQWTIISGPSSYNIANPTSSVTSINGLTQGTYQFELTVTDNNGAIGSDIVQITVNAAANIPPVANAGSDNIITLPTNSLTVSGSGSDADGTVVGYQWTKISGPSSYSIVNPTSAVTNITGLVQGVYQFQLKVTDNNGATGTDIMQITVNAAANIPPVANAGADWTIALPTNSLTVSGSGIDADGTVTIYQWTKISGPSAYTITNATSAVTNITGLVQGVYQFQLKVTDNDGATGTDIMQVTVNAAANIPPVADAGTDQTITLPVNSTTLIGSGSDADGTISGYRWTKISGPSSYNIVNPTTAATDITGLVQGVYQFQLKVTDNDGATGTDIMQVTVNAAANIPPVADAGPDQVITLPADSANLAGSGNDSDGTIVGYQWTIISGPSSYNIANPTSSVTSINGLTQGTYQFELTVTDNNGAIGSDIVQITVNAAANIPPVANAGSDNIITLPTNSLTVSGSGSDADGTVVGYQWTKISGPSSYSIVNPTSAVTNITGLVQGVYQFQLKVTDNNGATGTDIMQITVNAAANIPPVANAGADWTIALPTNSLTVSGSGIDADGTVTIYQWTKISGPSAYTITNATSAVTNITGLVQGVYQFQLKVTDNDGATGTDIMQVTVNAAANIPPVADAGTDQTITLPVNSTTLIGSGSDADGTISGYRWTKISGPSSYNIVNPTTAATDITGLVQGVYQFQLKVTDNDGATGTDIMQVTVNAAANIPPVADAGPDNVIALPVNALTASGSGSDADGTIVSYQWTKISGPSSYNIVTPTAAVTSIVALTQGTYQFELRVTDNNGARGRDTMQIIVNAAPIQLPFAYAGPDQTITLPEDSVTLSGSGTDGYGTVVGYSWKQLSGPAASIIDSSNNAVTAARRLVGGNYEFELTVTDNRGAIAKDTVIISVAEPRLNLGTPQNQLKVYPNPVVDITTLEINANQVYSKLLVIITDIHGRLVYKSEITPSQSNVTQEINMSNLAKGTYIGTVYFSDKQHQTIKLLKL